MSTRRHPLDGVRADGWFDRVLAGVPALGRLCAGIGEALVALSLVAGYRIISASVDRNTNAVSELQWVRDVPGGTEAPGSGTPDELRDAVIASLTEEEEETIPLRGRVDDDALRAAVGMRTILLAPLFGIDVRAVLVGDGATLLALGADDGEVEVPLAEVRKFLRARVVEVLRAARPRTVAVDLAQLDAVREAGAEGRDDDVLSVMAPQFATLVAFLRTPDGAAMGPEGRAVVARALVALGRALMRIERAEECGDALRLAAQYAQDGPAASEVYLSLGETLLASGRAAEAIGPLRRAMALTPSLRTTVLPSLAGCYLDTGRAVAAAGLIEELRAAGQDVATLEARASAALGEAWVRWRWAREGRRPVAVPIDGTTVSADG
jgi:tetratricopeptide (TPR) repeat protein